MISLLKLTLKSLPWLIVVLLLSYLLWAEKFGFETIEGKKETYQSSLLTKIEKVGKLEVVKYNFQEVTEVKKAADRIDLKFWKLPAMVPDSRALLISQGSAVGCIDLAQVTKSDISLVGDTLFLRLPAPELCYFKLDLEKSRLYDLQISGLSRQDQKTFMQELYKIAEADIRKSALSMGLLEQARENAISILTPILETTSEKVVIIQFKMEPREIRDSNDQSIL